MRYNVPSGVTTSSLLAEGKTSEVSTILLQDGFGRIMQNMYVYIYIYMYIYIYVKCPKANLNTQSSNLKYKKLLVWMCCGYGMGSKCAGNLGEGTC